MEHPPTPRSWPLSAHAALITMALLFAFTAPLAADEIKLGTFPRGQWLDTQWQAYWTFGDDTITLRDAHDKVLYDFAGIVQNMKVTALDQGGVRLTFDCAKARRSYLFEKASATSPMRMEIRQTGSSIAYKVPLPVVSEQQLAAFKEAVIAEKPADVAKVVAAIQAAEADPAAAEAAKQAASQKAEQERQAKAAAERQRQLEAASAALLAGAAAVDFAQLETIAKAAEQAGQLDAVIQDLEAQAARPDAPPQVFIALSALYGRKGLKTQEYAALELAEKAPAKPGVALNVSLVYGRKQLLAGAPDAKSFMVGDIELAVSPTEAMVNLDGRDIGTGSRSLSKFPAGKHFLKVYAEGYEGFEQSVELGVGQTPRIEAALVAKPCFLEFTIATKDAWVRVDGESDYYQSESPVELPPGDHTILVMEPNHRTISDTVSLKPGQTVKKNWGTMELVELPYTIRTDKPGATVSIDGKTVGTTPITKLPVLAGKHKVRIELAGQATIEGERDFWAYYPMDEYVLDQYFPFLIPIKTIKIDGNDDDWQDVVKPKTQFPSNDANQRATGTQVQDFRICQDKDYIYCYLGFADGRPKLSDRVAYLVNIVPKNGTDRGLTLHLWNDKDSSAWMPVIKKASGSDDYWKNGSTADYRTGPNFMEMRFPRGTVMSALKPSTDYYLEISNFSTTSQKAYSSFQIQDIRFK
jgi:hypothetical protein